MLQLLFAYLLFDIFGRFEGGFLPEIDTFVHPGIEGFYELVGIEIKILVPVEQALLVFRRRCEHVNGRGKTGEINDEQ